MIGLFLILFLENSILILTNSGNSPIHWLLVILMIAILTRVRWNLSVILNCVSFMAKNVEQFFMDLFAICTSFENCLSNSFGYLLICCYYFMILMFRFKFFIYILDIFCPVNSLPRFSPIL
jgi:hypothetical protein